MILKEIEKNRKRVKYIFYKRKAYPNKVYQKFIRTTQGVHQESIGECKLQEILDKINIFKALSGLLRVSSISQWELGISK